MNAASDKFTKPSNYSDGSLKGIYHACARNTISIGAMCMWSCPEAFFQFTVTVDHR